MELPAAAGALPATAAAPSAATERFLGQAESLLYYRLKASLPDFEVFAGVSLARVVGATGSGRDRELQLRRLSQYQLDFVIGDKVQDVHVLLRKANSTLAGPFAKRYVGP